MTRQINFVLFSKPAVFVVRYVLIFFSKFWRTQLVPLFWISGDVSGFQNQSGFCLIHFLVEVNVMYILKIHLWWYTCQPLGSQQHSWSLPHMHQQRCDLAQIRTGNHLHRRQMRYHCASDRDFIFQYLLWLFQQSPDCTNKYKYDSQRAWKAGN